MLAKGLTVAVGVWYPQIFTKFPRQPFISPAAMIYSVFSHFTPLPRLCLEMELRSRWIRDVFRGARRAQPAHGVHGDIVDCLGHKSK